MGQGLNMKTVTVRKTLRQTAESFISWPVCHEKRQACQILQAVKAPKCWLALIFSFPPHKPKPHRKIVSLPSYLCLLATCLFMPSPCLTPFLPAVTMSQLLLSGGFRVQLQSSGEAQAGEDSGRVLVVCTDSGTAAISTQFLADLNSTLAPWQMLALMALIFPLSLPLGEFLPPLAHSLALWSVNILWKIWFVLFSLARLFIIVFFHVKHIYLLRDFKTDNQSCWPLTSLEF